ncbi:capsid protein VP1 [Macaca fascicularis chapparvovirus]|uniref:Capsid protein VP1 n=1 Tax=Macaca fascicularis chapparvovirus TaxID=2663234 RepID=A0A5P9VKM2_9VIRU|nr:capsid protein VP1 [Macaca fascicularis chapparvovirus]QFX66144.1 capsid protein VP1 [Macaca fascicularis chapparvovirus]
MADSISLGNNYMCYWDNSPYVYGSSDFTQVNSLTSVNTGWHVLPTILWKHFLSPRQWYEMMINYEAYHVDGYTATLYNPIPLTQNLAIQATSTFTAFNNTIYTLGAQDTLYETSYHNWWADPLWKNFYVAYKEGFIKYGTTTVTQKRLLLPTYLWGTPDHDPYDTYTWSWDPNRPDYPQATSVWPHTNTGTPNIAHPTGIYWDPMTDPDSILELRPGKNSMTFNWSAHPCDENIWFNLDLLAKYLPYVPDGPWSSELQTTTTGETNRYGPAGDSIPNPNMSDPFPQTSYTTGAGQTTRPSPQYNSRYMGYSMPNLLNLPIVPVTWFWTEMNRNLIETQSTTKPQLGWPGTEFQAYKYPPTQSFVKGIPLFDENDTLIQTSTQGCIRVTLHLKVKKRRSRYFGPTWGPMSWQMTSTINGAFVLPAVRYRTGGARRGWQNPINQTPTTTAPTRWDPYTSSTYTTTSSSSRFTRPTYTTATMK